MQSLLCVFVFGLSSMCRLYALDEVPVRMSSFGSHGSSGARTGAGLDAPKVSFVIRQADGTLDKPV